MSGSSSFLTALSIIGQVPMLLLGSFMSQLVVALKKQTDISSIYLRCPPKYAFSGQVFWITGASSGIVSELLIDCVKLLLLSL